MAWSGLDATVVGIQVRVIHRHDLADGLNVFPFARFASLRDLPLPDSGLLDEPLACLARRQSVVLVLILRRGAGWKGELQERTPFHGAAVRIRIEVIEVECASIRQAESG